jgi:hypothetical protein
MVEIKYHRNVLLFLDELTDILIDKGYFSFYENSAQYMEDMVCYIKKNIAIKQQNPAPPYFSKYGDNLLYITYKRNKQTTWYIFFQKFHHFYFILNITNNHVAAKYFG